MNQLIQKLTAVEKEIAEERGVVRLFAVFEREEPPGKWDVVFSAPWVRDSRRSAIDYVVGKTQPRLDTEEILAIARYVPLRPSEEFVRALTGRVRVQHGLVELKHELVNGVFITRGYVITSQPTDQLVLDAASL